MSSQKIDDKMMANVEILAQLQLMPQEREEVQAEMEKILNYVEKLNELDTEKVEPLVHILPEVNVFRADQVANDNGREATLANAPKKNNGQFQVPKTV